MTAIRSNASFIGITFGMACALAACFGSPFTLGAAAVNVGEGGAAGQGGAAAGGGQTGNGGAGASAGTSDDTTLVLQDGAGRPVSDINVVVNDEAGAVVGVTVSGGDGRATLTIPIGGSTSVFSAEGAALHIFTIVDPPRGLTIPVTVKLPAGAGPEKTTYQVVIDAQPAGTDSVYVWSTCDYGWSNAVLDNAQCLDSPTIDFLAVAYDAENNAIAWGILHDQFTYPGGDTIYLPMDVTETAFSTLNAQITGALPADSHAGVTVGGDAFLADLATLPSPIAPPPLTVTFRVPTVPGMGFRVHDFAWSWSEFNSPSIKIERWRRYDAPPAFSVFAVDAMASLSVNPLDVADPVHPKITWSVAGDERGDQGTLGFRWGSAILPVTLQAVFAPDHTTAFRLPDIPSELSSYAPSATSPFEPSISVWYDDFENAEGYGDVLDGVEPADGLGMIRSGAYFTQP